MFLVSPPFRVIPKQWVVETGERRRYHLHESDLQETLYNAVRKAKIPKKVAATHPPRIAEKGGVWGP